MTLPFPVDADRAEANFDHGILRVVLPKAEAVKPKQIAIHTGQDQAIEANSSQESESTPGAGTSTEAVRSRHAPHAQPA